jgi:cell division protein FtsB
MEIPKPSYEELVDFVFRLEDKIAKKQWEIDQLREENSHLRAHNQLLSSMQTVRQATFRDYLIRLFR